MPQLPQLASLGTTTTADMTNSRTTMKAILDQEQARKDNKRAPAPKRQRPKGKTGMQVLMDLLTPKPH